MKKFFNLVALVAISLLFVQCEQNSSSQGLGKHKGHEYVDLGLPSGLKWATCNVGATTPEEYGDYFAWGEVEPKDDYSWEIYKYGTEDNLTKYNSSDGKLILDAEDDAAIVNWGGKWRMPTTEEQQELLNNCTWDWTTQNGVYGCKVIGPNGNSIFLPAAGYMDEGTLDFAGLGGAYWSSSFDTSNSNNAYYVYFFTSDDLDYDRDLRYYGITVRPVCE